MSRIIAELLGIPAPILAHSLDRLEASSGHEGIDARLTGEIVTKTRLSMRSLGLDPRDTTGRELYHALLSLAQLHDHFLAAKLGATDPERVDDMLPRIRNFANSLPVPRKLWVVKLSVAKRMLKKQPPTKLMKFLNYRSVDSLIKREPITEVLAAIRFTENSAWMDKFIQMYDQLQPGDFEYRDMHVILLSADKWQSATSNYVKSTGNMLTNLKEYGLIVMLPMPAERIAGITLAVLPRVLHYQNEMRAYSAFFKLQQVKPDFSAIVRRTIQSDPQEHASIAGQSVHWRLIQRHFSGYEASLLPEIFEPHVALDDLFWRKAEEILYRFEPALHFWHNMDYTGVFVDGRPVSFNLMDMAVNLVNRISYGRQSSLHLKEALQHEMMCRYLRNRNIEYQILRQLDDINRPELVLTRSG